MDAIINTEADGIYIDKENDRFFLVGRRVNVFDASTNKKLASLSDIPYKRQVYVSNRHNLIVVSSTVGHFAFYSSSDYSLLGTLKIRTNGNTDDDFYYDEDENAIYGIYDVWDKKALDHYIYRISPETMSYTSYKLLNILSMDNASSVSYYLHKHVGDDFFLRRNRFNEGLYGRFGLENGLVVLKKCIFSQNRDVEKYDIEERVYNNKIYEFVERQFKKVKKIGYYKNRIFRNERGLFLIFSKTIFRLIADVEFEKVYTDNYMSDYAEYNGKQYICTWEHCLVRDIEE